MNELKITLSLERMVACWALLLQRFAITHLSVVMLYRLNGCVSEWFPSVHFDEQSPLFKFNKRISFFHCVYFGFTIKRAFGILCSDSIVCTLIMHWKRWAWKRKKEIVFAPLPMEINSIQFYSAHKNKPFYRIHDLCTASQQSLLFASFYFLLPPRQSIVINKLNSWNKLSSV